MPLSQTSLPATPASVANISAEDDGPFESVLMLGLGQMYGQVGSNLALPSLEELDAASPVPGAGSLLWASNEELVAEVADHLCFSPSPDYSADDLALLQMVFDPESSEEARRRAVRDLGRMTGRTSAADDGLRALYERRRFAATLVSSFGLASTAFGEHISKKLEDNFVRARRGNELLYEALGRGSRLGPDPALFGPGGTHIRAGLPSIPELLSVGMGLVYEGLDLRRGIEPLWPTVYLPSGPNGDVEDWALAAIAFDAFHRFLTVDTANNDPAQESDFGLLLDSAAFDETESSPIPPIPGEPRRLTEAAGLRRKLLDVSVGQLRASACNSLAEGPDYAFLQTQAALRDIDPSMVAGDPRDFLTMAALAACSDDGIAWDETRQQTLEDSIDAIIEGWPEEERALGVQELGRVFGSLIPNNRRRQRRMARRLPFFCSVGASGVAESPADELDLAAVRLRQTCEDAYRSATQHIALVIRHTTQRLGLRPTRAMFGSEPDAVVLASEIYAVIYHSVAEGIAFRERFDPMCQLFELASGPDNGLRRWDFAALISSAMLASLYEPAES